MEAIGPLQLRVMRYVWQRGPSTVHTVLDALNRQPGCPTLAYTTILTVMRNLVRRGFLAQRPEGRSHVFAPLVDEGSYKLGMLRQLRKDLFAGDVAGLLDFLARDDEIAPEQRERIATLAP